MSDSPTDPDQEDWRIDELAHRAQTSVDTIRFYHRDGLLPPARREGRSGLYGPAHLRRLEQIRDLQARNFNLAAVKALLDESHLGAIQAMFSSDRSTFSRSELIAQSGLPEEVVAGIEKSGLLVDPAATGRVGFDQGDLDALRAVSALLNLGMPEPVALFFARLYAENLTAIEDRLAALLTGEGEIDWPESDRLAFRTKLGDEAGAVFELTGQLLHYAHRSVARRLAVQAARFADGEDRPAPRHGPEAAPTPSS